MIQDFLTPVSEDIQRAISSDTRNILGHGVTFMNKKLPDFSNVKIAIIGIEEERNAINNEGCSLGSHAIRKSFYNLFPGNWKFEIVDLGNVIAGESIDDTYFAMQEVLSFLQKKQIIPVILGGSQDLTYSQYRAFEPLEQLVNLIAVDKSLDIGDPEHPLDSQSYLNKIILQKPNILFNYSSIGYQSYYVDPHELDLMDQMNFDAYRLGEIKANVEWIEPMVRDADLLSFDICSIQKGFAPGCGNSGPNGLTGEESCALMRYAGLSDKMASVGIYEFNPLLDKEGVTAELIGQMLWYFLEGVSLRTFDYPIGVKDQYQKFIVPIELDDDLVFYKSHKSGRWWVEVPYHHADPKKSRHSMVPCSYQDYLDAAAQNVPERWWKASRKLV
ncbi:MAG: formiminoglutamase [Flavobacteriales bacterium]|jgi:formiminoglutamase